MEAIKNFRVRVMKYAWQYWRATKQTWRNCMIKAWQFYRLIKAMKVGEVIFYYLKVDGTLREARGTLKDIPTKAICGGKRTTGPSYKTMTYFDLDKGQFRSCRIENILLC